MPKKKPEIPITLPTLNYPATLFHIFIFMPIYANFNLIMQIYANFFLIMQIYEKFMKNLMTFLIKLKTLTNVPLTPVAGGAARRQADRQHTGRLRRAHIHGARRRQEEHLSRRVCTKVLQPHTQRHAVLVEGVEGQRGRRVLGAKVAGQLYVLRPSLRHLNL